MAQPERGHSPCRPDDLILIPGHCVNLGSSLDRLQCCPLTFTCTPRQEDCRFEVKSGTLSQNNADPWGLKHSYLKLVSGIYILANFPSGWNEREKIIFFTLIFLITIIIII